MLSCALLLGLITCTSCLALPIGPDVDLNIDYFQDYDTHGQRTLEYIRSKLDVKTLPPIRSFPLKEEEKTLGKGEIPQYVLDHCPLVHLYTEEKYLPYDISEFVKNFHLEHRNHTVIHGSGLTLDYLSSVAQDENIDDRNTFMTSDTDFSEDPDWLTGKFNKPDLVTGKIKNAPAVLVVVDKGNGWVDAYWFYFYSFNLGPFVMGHGPYGNHIGDWEHSLTRFYKGVPVFVWMSAHGGGGAYYYDALEKSEGDERKPIIFSARGTHANYPSTGQHPHDLPFGILSDFTDRGALWDPAQNYLGYVWDGFQIRTVSNQSKADNSKELEYGAGWLSFKGHWGDDKLAPNDPRQRWSPWEWKYIEGPTGPMTKHLSRSGLCQRAKWWNPSGRCEPKHFMTIGKGFESEPGVMCANLWGWVKPDLLRWALDQLTWGGGLCFLMNLIWG
ncbi:CYFA0S05e04104g1_1 [Cyberlindnera fabianii]|uniref:CYFA0S05e04104g1_1 n=1 Tax=Cyberlindnera fabianii TaxID=36022 RepID=A0A061AU99_CYBFA|nr:CYFA0S05e04104g1_1 [Cyberlindnera fabianii]